MSKPMGQTGRNELEKAVEKLSARVNELHRSLTNMLNAYDDTGCEGCGIVSAEVFREAYKTAFANDPDPAEYPSVGHTESCSVCGVGFQAAPRTRGKQFYCEECWDERLRD